LGNSTDAGKDGAQRQITDPRALRAMAHPLRLKLYELVTHEGSLTTSRASELLGQSTASCSFHLRQLAKYGFIELAPARDGRERPWRRSAVAYQVPDLADNPAFTAALSHATALAVDARMRALLDYIRNREAYPRRWRDAALITDSQLYLTADETLQLRRSILELTRQFLPRTRHIQQRPADARAVGFLAAMFPLAMTGEADST
jgi:hypothetical protein